MLNEYQNTVLFGANDELRERGATVLLFAGGVVHSRDRCSAERNAIYDLVTPNAIDGLIVMAPISNEIGVAELGTYCERFGAIPACFLSMAMPRRSSVVVDDAEGMRKLVEHLVDHHGKRRVAFIRGPVGNEEAERRYRVYGEVLARHGLAVDPALVTIGDFNLPSGRAAARTLCEERRVTFDALVAANDYMALGAMETLIKFGYDIPGKIAVAGFDDIDEARFVSPSLSTVRQPLYESGRHAAELVLAAMGGDATPHLVTLPTDLVLRESCGCGIESEMVAGTAAEQVQAGSVAGAVAARRTQLLRDLVASVPFEQSRVADDWQAALLEAFLSDLLLATRRAFSDALSLLVARVQTAGGSIRACQAVISVLRGATVGVTGDPLGSQRASALLHRASIAVSDARERAQAHHRLDRERWMQTLHETSEALMTAYDHGALAEGISRQLPRLEIPACALSVYDRMGGPGTRRAVPFFVYDDDRPMPAGDLESQVSTSALGPRDWLSARPRTAIVLPLVFREEQLGFALFEMGPRSGVVYERLRELLSCALEGARLVQQVVHEATSRQRAERKRFEKEMEIASHIQTSILPTSMVVPGFDLSAVMFPAAEVGGDYYDVVPSAGACWIGVGDVAGHGLQTGLVMLMIQSVVAALARERPNARPSEIVRVLNAVLFDNVRRRMGNDEHATLSLMRLDRGGQCVYAGAHEDIVVFRQSSRTVERISTPGPWVGAVPELGSALVDSAMTLGAGDVAVLYTDGVTEARNAQGVEFGIDRVVDIVARSGEESATGIRDRLVGAVRSWAEVQEDDVTVLVLRRTD
jgi:DNA-binding LacI/PurR family transcriptional regulator/serine phosphatase RsbU (regulator of sigma subunit)